MGKQARMTEMNDLGRHWFHKHGQSWLARDGWSLFRPQPAMVVLFKEARLTLALALPIIVGQVSQTLIGITDSAMIGRLGAVPLAAAAFTHSVFMVAFIAGIGLLLPVSVLVSRDHGAARDAECGEWLRHGLCVAGIFGALGTLAMLGLASQLHRFGQPPEVIAIVKPLYVLIALSLIPTLLFQTARQFAESLGRPWVPMAIMMVELVTNFSLNWLLIYGNLGAPQLGLTGAGVGTLAARWLGVVWIAVWLLRTPALRANLPRARRDGGAGWWAPIQWARVRTMLGIGLPAAGMMLFEVGAFSAAAIMIGWIDARSLAAHQVALSCAGFTFMFPLGISMAVAMRLSKAIGEGRTAALRPIGYGALGMAAAVMLAFGVVFAVAGRPIAALFVTDEAVITLAGQLLVIAAVFQLFDGVQVAGAGALRGLHDVRVPTAITFVAYWIIALPVGYFYGVRGGGGAHGVWLGLAAGLAIAAALLARRFARLTRVAQVAQPN